MSRWMKISSATTVITVIYRLPLRRVSRKGTGKTLAGFSRLSQGSVSNLAVQKYGDALVSVSLHVCFWMRSGDDARSLIISFIRGLCNYMVIVDKF